MSHFLKLLRTETVFKLFESKVALCSFQKITKPTYSFRREIAERLKQKFECKKVSNDVDNKHLMKLFPKQT